MKCIKITWKFKNENSIIKNRNLWNRLKNNLFPFMMKISPNPEQFKVCAIPQTKMERIKRELKSIKIFFYLNAYFK